MDFNRLLIEQIRKNPCLYNKGLNEYRNIRKKDRTWELIAKKLNIDVDTCRKRWKTLRDRYKKNKKESNPDKWKLSHALSFVDEGQDSKSEHEVSLEKNDSKSYIEDVDCDYDNLKSTVDDLDLINETEDPFDDADDKSEAASDMTNTTSSSEKARIRYSDEKLNEQFTQILTKCSESINELTSREERNSTSLLFESLARKIMNAQLTEDEVTDIEAKVTAIVYETIAECRQKQNTTERVLFDL